MQAPVPRLGERAPADDWEVWTASTGTAAGRREPAPQGSPVPASLGGGRYEVISMIGEGRHKRVCLALDRRLDRDVAVAVIKPEAIDEIGYATVLREARALAQLSDHRNIVAIYDSGEDEPHRLYFVTQYVTGGDLSRLIAGAGTRPIPVPEATRMSMDVARALQHVHEHRIVHRDVKPSNVWLAGDGTAKLGDFGLSCGLDDDAAAAAPMPVGTVEYIPPEQALGGRADERSDLYSLGALIYELLCGRPPFTAGDPAGTLFRHLYTVPIAPSRHRPDLPPALDELVLSLLSKEPTRRPQTAQEVVSTLDGIRPRKRRSPALWRRASGRHRR